MNPSGHEPEAAEVRAALATLVATEPALPGGVDDIERRGRNRVTRLRLATGGALASVVIAAGVVAAWPGAPAGGPASPPVAAAPATTTFDPAGGTMLPTGFPIGSAVDAVASAGVALAELPMDIGWSEAGSLTLPLAPSGSLVVTVAGGSCTAQAASLSAAQLAAVADAVCAAWRDAGSPDIIPAGPPGAEQPELAAQ
jgi:hypothetical protein